MDHRFTGPKIALFLNGEPPINLPKCSTYEKVFATDGAYHYLKKFKIRPDVISGDFDSADQTTFPEDITVIETPDQNFTDFEKALQIIAQNRFLNVDVWGGSGKKQDHFLGNLSTASKYKQNLSLIFYDKYHIYFFAETQSHLYGTKGKMVSLFPFPKAECVTTKGLKYPLYGEPLEIHRRIGIRNRAVSNTVEILFTSGALVIFVER
ncbi:MAG: thiamine diphosphokinase [Flavobacteriales bacterium AspAUS03]